VRGWRYARTTVLTEWLAPAASCRAAGIPKTAGSGPTRTV